MIILAEQIIKDEQFSIKMGTFVEKIQFFSIK